MHRFTIVLFFLSILFIQQQAATIYDSSSEEIQDHRLQPSSASLLNSWYNRGDDIQEQEEDKYVDRLWKRFSFDLSPNRQRRRFGNTRYGRSLPN